MSNKGLRKQKVSFVRATSKKMSKNDDVSE